MTKEEKEYIARGLSSWGAIIVSPEKKNFFTQFFDNLAEMRLFAFLLSRLNDGESTVKFKNSSYYRAVGIQGACGNSRRCIDESLIEILRTPLATTTTNSINIAVRSCSNKVLHTSEIEFHRELLPTFHKLAQEFKEKNMSSILKLKSKHSFRLYERLKSFYREDTAKYKTTPAYLTKIFDYNSARSATFTKIVQDTIRPAVKEISEKTDLSVSFEKVKEGNEVVAIVFNIIPKPTEPVENIIELED